MKRPRIIINCAMSADGKIALPNRRQMKISSDEDMKRVYQLRNTCDAILVGIGAVLSDDPKLTVKETYVSDSRQPVRVVLDSYCRTPEDALVVNDRASTLIMMKEGQECKKDFGKHVEILSCPSYDGFLDLSAVLTLLVERKITSVLVEGGGTVIWEFLRNKLVDDLYVFIGSMIIGGKQTPTMADGLGIQSEGDVIDLALVRMTRMKGGMLAHYTLMDK